LDYAGEVLMADLVDPEIRHEPDSRRPLVRGSWLT
jgi:hypothetical protein